MYVFQPSHRTAVIQDACLIISVGLCVCVCVSVSRSDGCRYVHVCFVRVSVCMGVRVLNTDT